MTDKPMEMDPKDQTRERLITAGLEMLATKGYRAATSREIARAAGLTEVTMYRHFRSKDELFAEAVRQFRQSLLGLIPAPSGDMRQDLLALVDRFYEHIATSSVKIMQVMPELRRHCEFAKPEVQLLQVEYNRRLGDLFGYYQNSGELTTAIGEHIAVAFMAPIYHYASQDHREQRDHLDRGKYVDLFLSGYRVTK